MIRSRAQLKAWFQKGMYPTAAQFADWIDSFLHLNEDKVAITNVEGLADALNGKYPDSSGKAWEEKTQKVIDDLGAHEEANRIEFTSVHTDINDLEDFLSTKNYEGELTFNANYIASVVLKRLRRSGNTVSFEFILAIAAGADMYNKQVVLCNNVPASSLETGNEIIPLAANYTPFGDEISLTGSFSLTAYAQGNNLYCSVMRATAGTQLSQITLTGHHILESTYYKQIKKRKRKKKN